MSHVYSPKEANYKQAAFATSETPDTPAALDATQKILARRAGFRADETNTQSIKLRPADQTSGGYYLILAPGDDYWIQAAPDTVFDIAGWVAESPTAFQTLRVIYQDT